VAQSADFFSFSEASKFIAAVIGLGFVLFQLRLSANSSKAMLLVSINKDLNGYTDVSVLIEEAASDRWVEQITTLQSERILDYISYLEGVYLSYRRGLFSAGEVNDHFAGRFFRIANDPGIQKTLLLNETKYGDRFRPIFQLHKALKSHRSRRGLTAIKLHSDLENANPELYIRMTR
jgi:hypothetical protein